MLRRLILAFAIVQATASFATEDPDIFDWFALWNACETMSLEVQLQDNDNDSGLTDEEITVAVRSRLRSARLYGDEGLGPYLHVYVQVFRNVFSVRLSFRKFLEDTGNSDVVPLFGFADTWSTGSIGTYGGDRHFILSQVSGSMDRFIDEYLRVNADACG